LRIEAAQSRKVSPNDAALPPLLPQRQSRCPTR